MVCGTFNTLFIGAGVRWLDKAAIGYPVVSFRSDLSTRVPAGGPAEPGDVRVSDVRNPFYGPDETRYDGWLSYSRRIFKNRFGMKLQLNVRNMFAKNELVPVAINPDGRPAIWSIAEGCRFTFSARFTF